MPLVLERSWVGQRVTVRRAVQHPEGNGVAFADVVGDLVALDADRAVIETRTDLVEIPVAHVAIAKLAPPSTRDELDLEAIVARGWQAADTQQLGRWTLRANGGFTGRANSVLPLGPPGVRLDEAIEHVLRWYAERGLPGRFQVPVEARRLLGTDLAQRGWLPSEDVHVMSARLDGLAAAVPAGAAVTIATRPDEEWFGVYRGGAGTSPEARGLLLRHDRAGFAECRVGGELVAIGRGTIDEAWLGVTAVEVVPAARRAGYATAVMAALRDWGRAARAVRTHLEVSTGNAAALALYARLGYRVHHDYRYLTAPGH
jgi:ribosomal protein S18 acetylase RimI-like enzyme